LDSYEKNVLEEKRSFSVFEEQLRINRNALQKRVFFDIYPITKSNGIKG